MHSFIHFGKTTKKRVFVQAVANHLVTLDADLFCMVNLQGALQSTQTGEVLLTEFILPDQLN